ncbi:hypothetical protein BKH21_10355 [Actinomyces oris]|nr:hypothetical protein BKH21_10355 [Actinomyces oris]
MSMVLTSPPHRRRTPKTNRNIPTILRRRFDGGPADVSAVDTGLRRSTRADLDPLELLGVRHWVARE